MKHLLNFCYLFLFVILIGCDTKQSDKPEKATEKKVEEELLSPEMDKSQDQDKIIVFFGNSLTAGLGVDLKESFPSLIQQRIDSVGWAYQVVNAGLSGETTAGGKARVDWVLNQKPDVFVLELGANDGLRGIPLEETRNNLQQIMDKAKEKNSDVKIVLVGMQIPPNMGPEYTSEFRNIFPELAEINQVDLIPFLLDGVAGMPELNQKDGIHPTADGQKIVAQNVWKVLETVIRP